MNAKTSTCPRTFGSLESQAHPLFPNIKNKELRGAVVENNGLTKTKTPKTPRNSPVFP
jgi:hypothetical protein